MAVNVTFYTFSKKINSTARPTGGAMIACNLKDSTTIISPSIEVQIQNPTMYNYCYIADFNRYYYIGDWAYFRGVWICNCNIDVLATYRTQIGASNMYVLRAAAEYDGNIIDASYPIKTEVTRNLAELTISGRATSLESGTYVVGIVNNDSDAIGAMSYYVMTNSQFKSLMQHMLGDIGWTGSIQELGEDLLKTLFNPFQYVVSVNWFPVSLSSIMVTGPISSIPYGWWDIDGIQCYRLGESQAAILEFTIDLQDHPQAAIRGNYLNYMPFSEYYLNIWPWGQVRIPRISTGASGAIDVKITIDLISGAAVLQFLSVTATDARVPIGGSVSAQIGVPIQIAQMGRDYLSILSKAEDILIGGIGDAVSGIGSVLAGDISGTLETASQIRPLGGIIDAYESTMPSVQMGGVNGCMLNALMTPSITQIYHVIVSEDNECLGRPLCQTRQLSTLPGYQKILGPDISLAATDVEINDVNQFLASGYFYE